MATLPSSANVTSSSATNDQMKSYWTALLTFLGDLLGTDSANKQAARSALGCLSVSITDSNSSFTFALTDAGAGRRKTNTTAYTWTIPNDAAVAFDVGTVIEVINDSSAGNVTLARGSGVVLLESTGTDGNRTVPPDSIASIQKMAANRWRIVGEYT